MPLTLEDRHSIEYLYATYYHRVDYDPERWPDCFTRDGCIAFDDSTLDLKGREAIVGFNNSRDVKAITHWHTAVVFEEGDDGIVHGSCHLFCVLRDAPRTITLTGHYDDQIVKEDGEWKFQRRFLYLDGRGQ